MRYLIFFFFQAEDGIRDHCVTGVQTCALPIYASVAVTEGLLQLMNDDELEGVIAHELSHVRNYDILISSIAATLAGAITWIAHWGPWLGGGDREIGRAHV